MDELARVRDAVKPLESLLVADSMTGQAAADIAKTFDEKIGITGVILSKFDSDARGGAALSLKSVTGKPVKFIGTSEKPEGLEPFYPDRIASRILGMGDVVGLVEKAQAVFDQKQAAELERKMAERDLSLRGLSRAAPEHEEDGLDEGHTRDASGSRRADRRDRIDKAGMKREEAILRSMTRKERQNHLIIGPSRRTRIAKGSGTSVAEINRLLKKFEKTRLMMKKMSKNKKYQQQLMGGKG